jgi:hypothetical protein
MERKKKKAEAGRVGAVKLARSVGRQIGVVMAAAVS